MKRLTINIDETTHYKLKMLALKEKITITELLLSYIEKLLSEDEKSPQKNKYVFRGDEV